jgi:4-oxalocrotonate tautomerase family enzyme|tara:strand:+ start:17514 stop:18041 length:528 start_codon:yes stop_codon:yes gene_type:complete
MPIITVQILEGYSDEEKSRLGCALTEATRAIIPAPLDAVTVIVDEMHMSNYMRGGVKRKGAPALKDAKIVVSEFIDAIVRHDLADARTFLADGFEIILPGGQHVVSTEELDENFFLHFLSIINVESRIEAFGPLVFYSGTILSNALEGGNPSGVRYIDRYELEQGRIKHCEILEN